MSKTKTSKTQLLPPPAGTILLYAADGLSAWKNRLSAYLRPRTPNRAEWVPMFRQLVDSHEGLRTLQSLAEAGMRAWRCPKSALDSLRAAFRDMTLRSLMIVALEKFAATAREKVSLPDASNPSPPASPPLATPVGSASPRPGGATPRRSSRRASPPTPGLD